MGEILVLCVKIVCHCHLSLITCQSWDFFVFLSVLSIVFILGGIDPFAFPAESDLPMMANVDDILVKHFVLQLACDLDKQTLAGSITLFLAPNPNATKGSKSEFQNDLVLLHTPIFGPKWTTDESEIQEVNPPKTVAPPPTAATAEWRFACGMENRSLYQYN